jgi:glycosyltransferase involved in cell wall biosynthesis
VRIAQVNDVASVAAEISAGLRALGHDVELLQPRLYGANLPSPIKPVVVPLRLIDWLRLARTIRAGRFDAVHIHYAYLGVVGLIGRFPYILHCHGDDVRDLARPLRRPVIRAALKGATHVFYSTPDLQDLVHAVRPDGEFLPNPIDTEVFRPVELDSDAIDVFIACSLSANKGVANLLEACRLLAERKPKVRITAIAGGDATRHFDALPNVTLIAHQPRFKLPALMGRHRVIVGQAHAGAVGMVELEGMAAARPVVCWFNFDEAYPEPPPFVRAHSGEEIFTAITHLLDDPVGAADIGCRGREWVKRYHGIERIAARVEAVAEQMPGVDAITVRAQG